ncbi:UNVERIFIED_CONTAM: Methyl-CpG-binding domain-containing protein 8 [Sesamum indicum]
MGTTAPAADGGSLQLESIPIVDLRLLSHSELYSLSLCSSSAFDPRRCHHVVIPKIDRSVFNVSAASRKQTYSRLRLAPPSTPTPHRRPTSTTLANITKSNFERENGENCRMVTLLKQLFVADVDPGELVPFKIDHSDSLLPRRLLPLRSSSTTDVGLAGRKRMGSEPDVN